jgi:hypothetical protein
MWNRKKKVLKLPGIEAPNQNLYIWMTIFLLLFHI